MAESTQRSQYAAIAALIAVSAGAGAIGGRATSSPSVEVRPTYIRILGDGQLAVQLHVRAGESKRFADDLELVVAADGSEPRLNGRPVNDGTAAQVGLALIDFATAKEKVVGRGRAYVRLLGDGQIAVDAPGLKGQLVFDKDGKRPRLGGRPTNDATLATLGDAAATLARKLIDLSPKLDGLEVK